MWQQHVPEPQPELPPIFILSHGLIELHVHPPSGDYRETWQDLRMEFGRFTSDSPDMVKKSWPALAISEARAALDDLERYLERQS